MADIRVAMVGTFDAANFGDVLFPVIAEHELRARLGAIELTAYGYRGLSGNHWPYAVRSLGKLPDEIASHDLLLIGGGLIVREDAQIADGYAPSDRRVHEPLGLWLIPALLAQAAGVPVAWNAVGVGSRLGDWLAPLVRAAVAGSAYVSVRDPESATLLGDLAPTAQVQLVPDTAFGAPSVLDDGVRETARALLEDVGIGDRGYVLVQSASGLSAVREPIEEALRAARKRDLAVLEVPFGPILGDVAGVFEMPGHVARLESWPDPAVLTAMISGASAIIHQSLHGGIVGFAAGVACLRRPMPAGKHDQLNGLPGVHLLGQEDVGAVFEHHRREPGATEETARSVIRGQLECHWDTVAELVRSGAPRLGAPLADLLTDLPTQFATAAGHNAELIRQRAVGSEYEAAYRAFVLRTDELNLELDALTSRTREEREGSELAAAAREAELARWREVGAANEAELVYLRERNATLVRTFDGGWWKLRNRLRFVSAILSRLR